MSSFHINFSEIFGRFHLRNMKSFKVNLGNRGIRTINAEEQICMEEYCFGVRVNSFHCFVTISGK